MVGVGCYSGLIVPDAHVWAWNLWEADGSRETLVTLWVIVLKTDLQLDGLEEVTLLGLEGVVEELLDVGAHSGCSIVSEPFFDGRKCFAVASKQQFA